MSGNPTPPQVAPQTQPHTQPTPNPTPAPGQNPDPNQRRAQSEPGTGQAIAAIATGGSSLLFFNALGVGLGVGIAAIVLAIIALKKKVKGVNKKLAIAGLILGIAGSVIGGILLTTFIVNIVNDSKTVQGGDTSFKPEDRAFIDEQKDFSKGDTAKFAILNVKVNSIKDNYDYADARPSEKAAYRYIVLNVSITNTSKLAKQVSNYDFRLEGDGFDPIRNAATAPDPAYGANVVVRAGQTRTGNIVYRIPKDYNGPIKLTYQYTIRTDSGRTKDLKYSLAL